MGTVMFTIWLRTFEKVQLAPDVFTALASAAWRSTNRNTRPPVIRAIETAPTDHASLEEVFGFIVASILAPVREEGKGGDPLRRGADPPHRRGVPTPAAS